jgi:plasmid stabilization system protein ParE
MKVILNKNFRNKLENLVDYIAQDRPITAKNFKKIILSQIIEASTRPYSCRKSIYSDSESVRDLIVKGYTIVFRIKTTEIEVIGLINREQNL